MRVITPELLADARKSVEKVHDAEQALYREAQLALRGIVGTRELDSLLADKNSVANELESAGVTHEMITYGGAPHGFTVFGSKRYQEAADKKSWKRFTEFLADTLKN